MSSITRKPQFLSVICLLLLFSAKTLLAQTAPPPVSANAADYNNRWDVFAGAAYAHFNGIGNVPATNLIGFNGQGTVWAKPVFGLSASVRGNYGKYPAPQNVYAVSNPPISQHSFLLGPDFRIWRTPKHALGFHVLLGGVYGRFDSGLKGAPPNAIGLYVNQLAFAYAVGGSFDFNLSPKFSVRVVTDYAPTHFGSGTQQEFAGAVGIVYKLGSLRSGR